MEINYDELMNYVKDLMISSSRKIYYSFRDRYNHTLRVLKWAERLQEIEGGDLEVIRIAAIFHDVGWSDEIPHGTVSKQLADEYLTGINYDPDKKEKVLEAIENHSNRKNASGLCLESYIVMDADILDEVGAISILWDAMATTYQENPSYKMAYERIKKFTAEIKGKKDRLKTSSGKKFYEERIKFIDQFLNELEFELNLKRTHYI